MTRNLPALNQIADDPGILKGLELDAIAALLDEAASTGRLSAAAKTLLTDEVRDRYGAKFAAAYQADGKDTGTVHVHADGFDIEVNTPKKVSWDQEQLATVADRIRAEGDNPLEYLERTLSVQERNYTAWPEHIRRQFEPARTVRPGTPTIKLAPAKSEAA